MFRLEDERDTELTCVLSFCPFSTRRGGFPTQKLHVNACGVTGVSQECYFESPCSKPTSTGLTHQVTRADGTNGSP